MKYQQLILSSFYSFVASNVVTQNMGYIMSITINNDHSIIVDMFNISMLFEDVVESYKLKLPQLNLSTIDDIMSILHRLPESEVTTTLKEAVKSYLDLNGKLI